MSDFIPVSDPRAAEHCCKGRTLYVGQRQCLTVTNLLVRNSVQHFHLQKQLQHMMLQTPAHLYPLSAKHTPSLDSSAVARAHTVLCRAATCETCTQQQQQQQQQAFQQETAAAAWRPGPDAGHDSRYDEPGAPGALQSPRSVRSSGGPPASAYGNM
jgi:hypothetical protein